MYLNRIVRICQNQECNIFCCHKLISIIHTSISQPSPVEISAYVSELPTSHTVDIPAKFLPWRVHKSPSNNLARNRTENFEHDCKPLWKDTNLLRDMFFMWDMSDEGSRRQPEGKSVYPKHIPDSYIKDFVQLILLKFDDISNRASLLFCFNSSIAFMINVALIWFNIFRLSYKPHC